MKKILLIAGLGIACLLLPLKKNFAQNAAQAATNRANILSVYKGIETGDLSVMDKFVADDVIDHADKEDIKGLENVKKMLADIHNHITNLKFTVISEATSIAGDFHFTLVRVTGTAKDEGMGMSANTPFDRTSVDVVRIKDGKIAEHWGFEDPKEMMKMMKTMHHDDH